MDRPLTRVDVWWWCFQQTANPRSQYTTPSEAIRFADAFADVAWKRIEELRAIDEIQGVGEAALPKDVDSALQPIVDRLSAQIVETIVNRIKKVD
jgi:hypothetical protein